MFSPFPERLVSVRHSDFLKWQIATHGFTTVLTTRNM